MQKVTTILGIKATAEKEGIVLFSDTQISINQEGKDVEKRTKNKIIVGSFWAMGFSGILNSELIKFYNFLKGMKQYNSSPELVEKTVMEAIEKKYFEKVNILNRNNRKNNVELNDLNIFLLAINKPTLKMYIIDEFGNLSFPTENNEIPYLTIGSTKIAEDYLENVIDKLDPDKFGIDSAIKIGFEAMRKAENDIHTGGPIDLVVLTKENIKSYGKMINNEIEKAYNNTIETISSKYSLHEELSFEETKQNKEIITEKQHQEKE